MAGTKSINDTQAYIDLYNKYALSTEQITTLEEAGGPQKAPKAHFVALLAMAEDVGLLGEVKQFALSITGSITKAALQARGWAICDGTTPASQSISDATITTTPNLKHKFIRMSNNETSGGTGGTETHNHTGTTDQATDLTAKSNAVAEPVADEDHTHDFTTSTDNNLPPYLEMVFFIKVKL